MSEIPRYTLRHGDYGAISEEQDAAGPYVRWDDHHAEVERLRADIARLVHENRQDVNRERQLATSAIHRLVTERDAAQRKAEQLQIVVDGERSRMDALRIDTQAAITLLTTQRDEAQVEVERLKSAMSRCLLGDKPGGDCYAAECVDLRAEVNRLTTERNKAQAYVKWLIDERNHSASLNSSRPSDEDIWREAFMRWSPMNNPEEWADKMLNAYRNRWPR